MQANKLVSLNIENHYFSIFTNEEMVYGRVHSVFNDLVNIELVNNEIIVIASNKISIKPKMIQVEILNATLFNVDDKVTFTKQNCFSSRFEMNLNYAEIQDCDIRSIWTKTRINNNWVNYLYNELSNLEQTGLLPMVHLKKELHSEVNDYCKFLIHRIDDLYANINLENTTKCIESIKGFIGVGIGLTPSSDDFLVGLILILYIECYNANKINLFETISKNIKQNCIGKTTKVSEYYLLNACDGYFDIDNLNFIRSLKGGKWDQDLFLKVKNHGHSSGTDFLVGFYLSLERIKLG